MKRPNILLLAAFCSALLVGCSTTASGPGFGAAKETLPALSGDNGRIFLYRTDVVASLLHPAVHVNGDFACEAVSEGFFYVDRPAGRYRISTGSDSDQTIEINLEKGQVQYVRLKLSVDPFGASIAPQLIDAQVAEPQIADCKLAKP
jgi:hypothetical protein